MTIPQREPNDKCYRFGERASLTESWDQFVLHIQRILDKSGLGKLKCFSLLKDEFSRSFLSLSLIDVHAGNRRINVDFSTCSVAFPAFYSSLHSCVLQLREKERENSRDVGEDYLLKLGKPLETKGS